VKAGPFAFLSPRELEEDAASYQLTKIDNSLMQVAMTKRLLFHVVLAVLGTQPALAQDCDVNYGGVCVPVASDVDCAGGSGNGPAYVEGPVYIIGSDIYGLDRDGDGVACEPK
jgi:hypothetical protein